MNGHSSIIFNSLKSGINPDVHLMNKQNVVFHTAEIIWQWKEMKSWYILHKSEPWTLCQLGNPSLWVLLNIMSRISDRSGLVLVEGNGEWLLIIWCFFLGWWKCSKLGRGDGCTSEQHCPLRRVNFTCELFFNKGVINEVYIAICFHEHKLSLQCYTLVAYEVGESWIPMGAKVGGFKKKTTQN